MAQIWTHGEFLRFVTGKPGSITIWEVWLTSKHTCQVPRFLARGEFNRFGIDSDVPSKFKQNEDGKWELDIMGGWPSSIQLNFVYDFDDYFYGDTNGNGVLDRLPPNSLAINFVNMSAPPKPHLSWTLIVDNATMSWSIEPRGYQSTSAALYGLLFIPPVTAITLGAKGNIPSGYIVS